jgi:hypothetical protein
MVNYLSKSPPFSNFFQAWKVFPAFNKLKDNMQSVYKTEEHMARVKQSKELGIELNESTIAGLSEEEYSKVVNLAQKASGSSTSERQMNRQEGLRLSNFLF